MHALLFFAGVGRGYLQYVAFNRVSIETQYIANVNGYQYHFKL